MAKSVDLLITRSENQKQDQQLVDQVNYSFKMNHIMAKEDYQQCLMAGILIMIKVLSYLDTARLAGEYLNWSRLLQRSSGRVST